MPSSFDTFSFSKPILDSLKRLNYTQMTAIQSASLPHILEGKNTVAKASTGSGKTLAFSLGVLHRLNPKWYAPQSLYLAPTRELSDQIAKTLRSLASSMENIKILTLTGGVPTRGHIHSLRYGAHIIVGTPGRVLKLIQMGHLDLSKINTFVLDEADRMIDMGFIEDIQSILASVPENSQKLLFSATYPDEIEHLVASLFVNAHFVDTHEITTAPEIQEYGYVCDDKLESLSQVLHDHKISESIIFCNTKIQVDELSKSLQNMGIHNIALHGDMEQFDRNEAILQFRNRSISLLIATDVAARGLDISGLQSIINYDLPETSDRYVHRIGRTGRAGEKGLALSLLTPEESSRLTSFERDVSIKESHPSHKKFSIEGSMQTICIDGGKKEKLRAGDILGALIHQCNLKKEEIGLIDIFDHISYVAIKRDKCPSAFDKLKNEKIKAKRFRIWLLD